MPIESPAFTDWEANEQGVVVKRLMVIASTEGGKTTLMTALAPELSTPDRRVVAGPVDELPKRLGSPGTKLYGSDRKACAKFFGKLLTDQRSSMLYLDEFDEFCPGSTYCCDELRRLINYSRNDPWRIGIFVSARGTSDVTKNAIRVMDVVFFGQCWEGNAVEYLRRSIKQGDVDFEVIVRNLPKFKFMVWMPKDGGFKGFIQVYPDNTWGPWDPSEMDLGTTTDSPPTSGSEDTPPEPSSPSEPPGRPTSESTASSGTAGRSSRTDGPTAPRTRKK